MTVFHVMQVVPVRLSAQADIDRQAAGSGMQQQQPPPDTDLYSTSVGQQAPGTVVHIYIDYSSMIYEMIHYKKELHLLVRHTLSLSSDFF